MKRLFNIAAIAVLALTAMSCQPSIIGEWHYIRTEYYDDGQLEEVDNNPEEWVLCFQDEGTGYQIEYGYNDPMYWLCEEDVLYIDNRPIHKLENAGCMKIKELDDKELHLARERRRNTAVYVFQRAD